MPLGIESRAPATDTERLLEEILEGLGETPKRLSPKLFYDERGAMLFERITELDAYYPTRTELGILREILPAVADRAGARARVVEFGTGDGRKLGMLLDALRDPAECIPIDISREQLLDFARELRSTRPNLRVYPLPVDYTRPFSLPEPDPAAGRVLFFFPGSTIGNLEPADAVGFLEGVRKAGGAGSLLLVGIDLVKPAPLLRRAYDDEEGVTAAFNRNALRHLNRRFDADFDVDAFEHRAIWNEEHSRIEMRLVCTAAHTVTLGEVGGEVPVSVDLGEGEEIVTEHSYKYRLEDLSDFFSACGWAPIQTWTDDHEWFSVSLLEAGEGSP